jgi:hypothetical protein
MFGTQRAHIWRTQLKKMGVIITQRLMRNQRKIYYSFEWGKKRGQRKATGIFTYTHLVNKTQEEYNK